MFPARADAKLSPAGCGSAHASYGHCWDARAIIDDHLSRGLHCRADVAESETMTTDAGLEKSSGHQKSALIDPRVVTMKLRISCSHFVSTSKGVADDLLPYDAKLEGGSSPSAPSPAPPLRENFENSVVHHEGSRRMLLKAAFSSAHR
jgi:hypothetical protein